MDYIDREITGMWVYEKRNKYWREQVNILLGCSTISVLVHQSTIDLPFSHECVGHYTRNENIISITGSCDLEKSSVWNEEVHIIRNGNSLKLTLHPGSKILNRDAEVSIELEGI